MSASVLSLGITPRLAPQAPLTRGALHVVHGSSWACERCAVSSLCLPPGLATQETREFSALLLPHKRVRAGQALFRTGEPSAHVYRVKAGSFKTVAQLDDGGGREQITGFHFAGEMLGIDALGEACQARTAIALEDATVCAMPAARLADMARRVAGVHDHVQRLLLREVTREQALLLLLGSMTADERVAAFLRNLSMRFGARGYSPYEFTLPMMREDIGSHLGLTLETVSRCFSRLKNAGVIEVDNRRIRILDVKGLQRVLTQPSQPQRDKCTNRVH